MATITSLDFNVNSNWDGSGIRDAKADIESLKAMLDSLSDKRIGINLDDTAARSAIDSLKADLDSISNKDVKLSVDDSAAKASIAALKADLDSISNKDITLGIDDAAALSKITALKSEIAGISNKDITLGVDDSAAMSKINALKAAVDSISNKSIRLTVDDTSARATIESLKTLIASVSNKSVRISVDDTAARAKIDEIKASLATLHDRTVNVRVDGNQATQSLDNIGRSASGANNNMHLLLTSAVALAPAAVTLAFAFGGAGLALVPFAASLFGTYKSAVSLNQTIDPLNKQLQVQQQQLAKLTPGTKAYTAEQAKIATTQLKINDAMQRATPEVRALQTQMDALHTAWQKFQAEAEKTTGPVLTAGFKALTDLLPKLLPLVRAVGPIFLDIAKKADQFIKSEKFTAWIKWLSTTGVAELKAVLTFVGQLFGGFLSAIRTFAPSGDQFKAFLQALSGAFNNVLRSAAGLGPTILSLTTVLLRLVAALPPSVIQAIVVAFVAWRTVMIGMTVVNTVTTGVRALSTVMAVLRGSTIATAVGLAALRVGALAVAAGLWIWTAAQTALDVVTGAFAAILDSLGIGELLLLIGLIIGALVALLLNWRTVWNAIKAFAELIWKGLVALWNLTIGAIIATIKFLGSSNTWVAVWHGMEAAGVAIWHGMEIAWRDTVGAIEKVISILGSSNTWITVWNGMKTAAEAVWNAMKVAWSAVVSAFSTVWTAVSGALVVAWNAVWNGMKIAAQAIWTAMQVAWSAVVTAFSTVWTAVSGALTTAWNAVWNALKVAAEAIWTAMQVAWTTFINALATVWTAVSGALTTAWNAVWNALKVAAEAIWTAMQVAWTTFINALATIWTAVSSALTASWNAVWNALKTAAQAIWTAMQVAWQAFINALNTIWQAVSSALSASWNAIWNAMKTAALAIWNALQAAWSAFWTTMRNLFNAAMGAIQTSWSLVWNAIKTVGIAIWDGIRTAWNAFWSFMRTVLVGALDAIKSSWSAAWNAIKTVGVAIWNFIKTAAHNIWLGMQTDLRTFVQTAKDIWNGLKEGFEAPIRFVVETVLNGGIIKAIDWIISKLGGPAKAIPDIPKPFAEGGPVSGPGTGTSDSIMARLSDGEHVWTAREVQAAGGHGAVQQMRAAAVGASQVSPAGNNGGFATGGAVNTSGGLSIGDIESMFGDIIKSIGGAAAGILAKGIASAGSLAKFVGGGIQSAGKAVAGAAGHIPVVGGAAKSAINAVAGFFGGGAKKVGAAASGIAGAIDAWGKKEFTQAAGDLINKVLTKLPIPGGNGVIGEMGSDAVKFMFGFVGKKLTGFIADFLFKKQQQQIAVTSQAVAGSKSVQAWTPVVLQALAMEGHPASWVGPIEQTMQKESGGNPNAINRTDINAQHGIPSQGLMQVIPPTFARYHEAGTSNNILDPLANIAAAINYIVARYGRPTGMSPYANGTDSATAGMHLVGERGPEMVMFGGGEQVKTASETSGMMGGALPSEQLKKNLIDWTAYHDALKAKATTTWDSIKQTSSASVTSMGAVAAPVLVTLKNGFDNTGNDIMTQWKANWNANGTMFQGALTTAQNNANNFNDTLKKNFANNGTVVSAQWKQNWDTNGTVLQNDLTLAQNNATSFQDTLKSNFNNNNAAVSAAWKTAWETNGTVFLNNTNTTQSNATAFNDTLKSTFATNQNAVSASWKTMWDKATTDAQTDFTTMTNDSNTMWTGQKTIFNAGSAYLTNTFFPPVNDLMVNKLPASFATSVQNIGVGWLKLEAATHDPVAAVVNTVYNKGIVGVWNLIAKAFGAPPLTAFTMPAFATGGEVNGPGTGTSDSIMARLSAGEHVWTASEVSAAGGHDAVAKMRSNVLGGSSVRTMGNSSHRYPTGGGVPPTPSGNPTVVGGNPHTPTTLGTTPTTGGATAATTPGGSLAQLAAATLGSIHQVANPIILAAVAAGKKAVDAVTLPGSGMQVAGENMGGNMGKAATDFITANDILPTFGGGSDASAQAWADSRVGEPYVLGGDFVHGIDCSEYQSGIAKAILGQTPGPWFTTFAFNGATAPPGFKQNLQAPYMVGVTNVGVGHMAGTLNGTNYEATPPAVRKGPGARGWNDPMFSMHYGFQPSIQAVATGGGGVAPLGSHLATIDAALAAAGIPPPGTKAEWEAGMNVLVQRESSWNPNAINLTDSNAAAGHPSQGLAQVIPSTFATYHVAGTSSNILDPVANLAAAMRYIVARYGNITNVQQANPNLPPLGYSGGTDSATPGWHMIDENGDEWINFRGGEKVLRNGRMPDVRHHGADHDDADCTHVSIENHWHGNPTTDAVAAAGDDMATKLHHAIKSGTGKRRGR